LRARVITATNIDIEKEVEEGQFRQDLFYRVNVSRILVPPLKERREDIPLILDHFVQEANKKLNKKIAGVSEKVLEKLVKYNWPGNVRELENTIINMCIKTHGNIIEETSVPDYIREEKTEYIQPDLLDNFLENYIENYKGDEGLLSSIFDQIEHRTIKFLQKKYGNNKSRIAKEMGISRVTLTKKMKIADV